MAGGLPINAGSLMELVQMGAIGLAAYEGYLWYTGSVSVIPNDPIIAFLRTIVIPDTYTPPTTCPTGYVLSNGSCVPVANPCPTGYHLANSQCVADVTSCPTGYSLVNGVCVYNNPGSCPTGQQLVNGVCVPITCPSGQQLVNGVCVQTACQTGFHLDPITNACVSDAGPVPGDVTKPLVVITQPVTGFSAIAGNTVLFKGLASDNIAVIKVELQVDGNPYQIVHADTAGFTTWSMNVPLPTAGTSAITARASDANGNLGYYHLSLNVLPTGSTPPPQPTCGIGQKINTVTNLCEAIVTLEKPSFVAGEVITVRASGFTPSETVQMKLVVNNVDAVIRTSPVRTDGGLTNTITTLATTPSGPAYISILGITSGLKGFSSPITMTGSTGGGNVTDVTPPVVAITSPANGTTAANNMVNVTGTASDIGGSGINAVFVRIANGDGTPWQQAIPLATDNWSTWSAAVNLLDLGTPGPYLLEARADDKAGNQEWSAQVSVNYLTGGAADTTPPVLIITAPAGTGIIVPSNMVTVTGTATDTGSGVLDVFVRTRPTGSTITTGYIKATPVTANFATWSINVNLVANGVGVTSSYDIIVLCHDNAGNQVIRTVTAICATCASAGVAYARYGKSTGIAMVARTRIGQEYYQKRQRQLRQRQQYARISI